METDFTGFVMKDMEILHNENGNKVMLCNGAKATAEKLKIKQTHISISHEDKQSIVFAVVK